MFAKYFEYYTIILVGAFFQDMLYYLLTYLCSAYNLNFCCSFLVCCFWLHVICILLVL